MKKLLIVILLLLGFVAVNAQLYDKKIKSEDLGTWNKELSSEDKISISSYVTKQNIVHITQKQVADLPKYRYELVLVSNSVYKGNLVNTWIYGAKVFIDSTEVTREQSPDGFTAIIGTTPTVVYRYDTSIDTINIKITWKSSVYHRSK